MIKTLTIAMTLVFASAVFNIAQAQKTDADKKDASSAGDKKASLKIGVDYSNNSVYLGRSDSISTPVISPNIRYTFASGIFVSGSLAYIPNRKKKKLDGVDLSTGYDFNITDNLDGGVAVSKQFYSSTSTRVSAATSATFNANLSYDVSDIVSADVSADYNLNRSGVNNDIIVNFGLSHDIAKKGIFSDNDFLLISPSASLNAGTQNFYDDYTTRIKKKNLKLNAAQNAAYVAYKARLNKFNILDYEFSVPLVYKTGMFSVNFTPTYAIAQNRIPTGVVSGKSDQSSVFYFEIGVGVKF